MQFRGGPGLAPQPFHDRGSGFITSTHGLFLSNEHVMPEANEVTVKLSDRREFEAKLPGSDLQFPALAP
jgi:serine protease Do